MVKKMKNNIRKNGISLLVLIVTIIIITILAGTVILSLAQNNPISQAGEAKFKANVASMNDELTLWLTKEYAENTDTFNISNVNANKTVGEYDNLKITDIISSMGPEYESKFEIQNGKLVYIGTDANEKNLVSEVNIPLLTSKQELLNPLVWLKTTDMITDWLTNTTTLTTGGVTGQPYARVLWNYNKNTLKFSNFTNNPKASMLSNTMTAIALLDAYEYTKDGLYSARAYEIGDQIAGTLIPGKIYDEETHKFIVTEETQNTGWADAYDNVYTQDIALAATLQFRLYMLTNEVKFKDAGNALMETLCWSQDYADYTTVAGGGGPYPNEISGGIHEYFTYQGNQEGTDVFYPSETLFSLGNADMIVTAFQTAYIATNDIGYQSRLNWYKWFITNLLKNYGCINANGYIYEYYADQGDGWKPQNWNNTNNAWGPNEPFTANIFFHCALGVAKVDTVLGAQLLSKADEMQDNNIFHGQYNIDGTPDLNEDYSESISTGMYLELQKIIDKNKIGRILNIQDTLINMMTTNSPTDKNAQYAFEWSTNAHDGIIESIATSSIISNIINSILRYN